MIFYDFEVFRYNWMVYFINAKTRQRVAIIDSPKRLRQFYEAHKNEIFIGYNNLHYDQYIFKGILLGMDPWVINDEIINKRIPGWKISGAFRDVRIINYDLQPIFAGQHRSLKQLEAYMGHNIKESTVDFNIPRKLTQDEIKETLEYCKYDVEQTMEVFVRTIGEFETKLNIIKEFNLPISYVSKTNAQLSAEVLQCIPREYDDDWDLDFPDTLQLDKYKEVLLWYKNPFNRDDNKQLDIDISGVPHTFKWGGLHGARKNYIKEGKFVLADVSSFYPSMMIQYDYMSRNISDKNNFIELYKERFRLKEKGDPNESIFKLILNTTYGCMGYKYNKLYDKRMRTNVGVTGQLLLLDLIEKVELNVEGIELVQSNTDGVLWRYETEEQLEAIKKTCNEWSERTELHLDYEFFNKVIQKDVNNYMAVNDKYTTSKGSYLKEKTELDNDLPIVTRALIDYLKNGTKPEETIMKENKLIEFQKIVKVSNKYDYAIHNNNKIPEKTIRIFASKELRDGPVYKYRNYKGEDQYSKFQNTSEHVFIDNGYIKDKKVPEKLDKQWYIDLAWRRILQFQGEDENVNPHQVRLF